MRLQVRKGWWAPSSTKGVQMLTLFSPDLLPAYHTPNSKSSIAPEGKKKEVGTTSPSPFLKSHGLMILMTEAVPGRAKCQAPCALVFPHSIFRPTMKGCRSWALGSSSPEHLGGGHSSRVES